MSVKDAAWQVTAEGGTWVHAKLVGDNNAVVAFNDIVTTINGGVNATNEVKAQSLAQCGTAGGQMGVGMVNSTDLLCDTDEFVKGSFTSDSIAIWLVHNPDVD